MLRFSFALAVLVLLIGREATPLAQTPRPLIGRVVDALSGEPVSGALVAAGEARGRTAGDGTFSLEIPPGARSLTFVAAGYLDESLEIGNVPPERIEVRLFRLAQFAESVEVRAAKPPIDEPVAIAVEPSRVLEVAGSLDNVFRTIQTLPGVAATEDFGSRLSVRGGSPDQNLTVMDGVEVHNPYRLFGLTSAFNPETVESFELTAGGFSAKYGDRLSSLLVIRNRAGRRDQRLSGSTSASITDANVILEGGFSKGRGSWLLTGRRTYYDLVAERIVDENLPSFGDVQAKLGFDVGTNATLSFFGLRSRENTDLSLDSDDVPGEFGSLFNEAGNDLLSVTLDASIGVGATSRSTLAWYRNTDTIDFEGRLQSEGKRSNSPGGEAYGFSNVDFDRLLSVEDLSFRQDFSFVASDRHLLETGFELHVLESAVRFESSGDRNPQEANGSSVRGGAGLPDFIDSTLPANRVGAWFQDAFTFSPAWTLEPGVRIDWSQTNGSATVSPRFAASYRVGPSTRLRGAAGLYTQSPGYEKLIQSDFFIDLSDARALGLRHERSTHVIAGLERDFAPGLTARFEGFYKTFDDVIVGRLETEEERLARIAAYDFPPDLKDSVPASPIITSAPSNDASGSAYGFDLFLSRDPSSVDNRLSGWAAYTWTRADRDAYGRTYPFDYDRRHSLNLVGSYRLTRTWTLGLTGRLASGFPYTAAVGVRVSAVEDPADPGRLIPETDLEGRYVYVVDLGDSGNLNTGRFPFYARLDLRATWRPGGNDGRFELYLEAINLLNRENAVRIDSELRYDPGSEVPSVVALPSEGFPFLPSFGVRYRF